MKKTFYIGMSNQPIIDKKPISNRLTVKIRGNIAKFSLES